jgi:hypothetical protein
MIRWISLILGVVVVAVTGGAASVWYMLQAQHGVGAMTVGPWTAYPEIGTPDADPYSKARIARDGVLTLGRAEGLVFVAERDSSARLLLRDCNYLIEGGAPTTRFWTLFAADEKLAGLELADKADVPAIQSRGILRQPDNSFVVGFGPHPVPGNWVRISGSGPMTLVLTLYDTPIEGDSGLVDLIFPRILRTSCDD